MKLRHLAFALCLGLAGAAQAQVVGYNFQTGDLWVDTQLGYMSDYGRYQRDYFVDDIVGSYGAPRYLVNDLLVNRHWDPGDVYYASALAYQLRRPLSDIVRERDRNRGQGWGVIAQRMGIKPGSAEFHALKGHMGKSKARYESHGGRPGKSDKGRSDVDLRHDDGPGNSGGKGKGKPEDAGPGNSGKPDKGKGNGKGNGKGKG